MTHLSNDQENSNDPLPCFDVNANPTYNLTQGVRWSYMFFFQVGCKNQFQMSGSWQISFCLTCHLFGQAGSLRCST